MSDRRQFLQSVLAAAACGSPREAAAAASFAVEFQLPFPVGGMPPPTFENGFVTVLDSTMTLVFLVDLEGRLVSNFSPRIPGAAVERISHVAVSRAGKLVLAMSAKDGSGRYSFFLGMADLSGQLSKLVQLHPYAVARPLFLPDGRLFCLGKEYDSHFTSVPGHQVLRFYSPEGVLLNKALNVDSFGSAASHPVTWKPALGSDRVGLLDSEYLRYCEIDFAGKIVRPVSKLGVAEHTMVTGLVLLPNGDRLATLDIPKMINGCPQYGSTCGVVQISDTAAGGLSLRERTDLMPAEPGGFVSFIGSHEGKPVFLARKPDRILIPA
ncbi:MAG: hypothetical protein ACKV22_24130 [Bryobacteraceae bacterium]